VACSKSEPAPNPQPDIPQYTTDQVIAVAKDFSPEIPAGYEYACKSLSWTATYIGQGTWVVTKICIDSLGVRRGFLRTWYFYEDTGRFAVYQQ